MKYFTLLIILIANSATSYPQWQLQNSGTTVNLSDVTILNQTSAVVVGDNGTILKTTDYGLNWVAKNSGTTNNLNAVSFIFENTGIAVGNMVTCKTTDAGETWSHTLIDKDAISVSCMFSIYSGYEFVMIGCDDGTILFSSDFGISWEDTSFSNDAIVTTALVDYGVHVERAYIVTTLYTAHTYLPPGPISWEMYNNPVNVGDYLTGGYLYGYSQYLIGAGGFSGTNPLMLRKNYWTDSTWVLEYSFVSEPFIPEDVVLYSTSYNERILFVCGSEGRIFKSTDGGDNWIENITNITSTLNSIVFGYNNSTLYAVGNNGTILFTSNGGINSIQNDIPPGGYYLYQNYPNPFNPSTNIRFRIAERSNVSLIVFDILGREIVRLVDEEKPAGQYSVEFYPKELASGIYFYQLNAGKYTTTRKMILAR